MKLDNDHLSHRLLATAISLAIVFGPAMLMWPLLGPNAVVGAMSAPAIWMLFFNVHWKWQPFWKQAKGQGKPRLLDAFLARIEPEAKA
jgi:hypothetical protein